jgi:hypothetical protein
MDIFPTQSKGSVAIFGGIIMKFGVYFYPWYNEQRWREAPRKHTPLMGEYDSKDSKVIRWQMDLIKACGLDYVVFEIVPSTDWCFSTIVDTIERSIHHLESRGLEWSFLVDTSILPDRENELYHLESLVAYIESRGWASGLTEAPGGKKLLFCYAPLPDAAREIVKRFENYEFRFPIWLPHWDMPDSEFVLPVHKPYAEEAKNRGLSIYDSLVPMGYIGFWEDSNGKTVYDGFSPVSPGYDDTLLGRDPQLAPRLPHEGGHTFVLQMRRALENNPENILVYSWNEYFETTNIEPTREYGTLYVDLVRDLIDKAKKIFL